MVVGLWDLNSQIAQIIQLYAELPIPLWIRILEIEIFVIHVIKNEENYYIVLLTCIGWVQRWQQTHYWKERANAW